MKILLMFSLLVLVSTQPAYSQSKGIAFQKIAWKQALSKASEDGKLIFVDVYTSWCGPCKLLDRDVFSDSQVGSVFNRRFINLKIDAEKGEGIALAKAYHVSAYPTLLFINSNGQLIHELIGLVAVSKLVKESDLALVKRGSNSALSFQGNQPLQSLTDWDQAYAQHKTDTSFLYQYIQIRHENNILDSDRLLDQYIQLLPPSQTYSTKNLILISTCLETFDSRAGQVLAAHIQEADKLEGDGYSMGRTFSFAKATFDKAVAKRDTHILRVYNQILPVLNKMYSPYTIQDKEDSLSVIQANRLRYLKATHDTLAYLKAVSAYVQTYLVNQTTHQLNAKDAYTDRWFMTPYLTGKEDSTQVPGFANLRRGLYQNRTRSVANKLGSYALDCVVMKAESNQLNQALEWTKRAEQLFDRSAYILTEASILKKLGRLAEARIQLEQGISRLKSRHEDVKELEEALTNYR